MEAELIMAATLGSMGSPRRGTPPSAPHPPLSFSGTMPAREIRPRRNIGPIRSTVGSIYGSLLIVKTTLNKRRDAYDIWIVLPAALVALSANNEIDDNCLHYANVDCSDELPAL